jgi:hypothetical protein
MTAPERSLTSSAEKQQYRRADRIGARSCEIPGLFARNAAARQWREELKRQQSGFSQEPTVN